MKKKILSLVLTLSMVLSFFPGMTMTASAADDAVAKWVTVGADDAEPADSAYGAPGTLADAFGAANTAADDEVTYVKLVDGLGTLNCEAAGFKLIEGQTMVLDLGQNTIKAEGTGMSLITVSGNLTVKNGFIVSNSTKDRAKGIDVTSGAVLTVTGCEISASNTGANLAYGIYANGATVTVSGGTIKVSTVSNTANGLAVLGTSNVTVKDGCIIETTSTGDVSYAIQASQSASLTVENSTLKAVSGDATKKACGISNNTTTPVVIKGNTVISGGSADIFLFAQKATINAADYNGNSVIEIGYSSGSVGREIVSNVTDSNKGKFRLIESLGESMRLDLDLSDDALKLAEGPQVDEPSEDPYEITLDASGLENADVQVLFFPSLEGGNYELGLSTKEEGLIRYTLKANTDVASMLIEAKDGYTFEEAPVVTITDENGTTSLTSEEGGYFYIIPPFTGDTTITVTGEAVAEGGNDAADIVINVDTESLPELYPHYQSVFVEDAIAAFSVQSEGYSIKKSGIDAYFISSVNSKEEVSGVLEEGVQHGICFVVQGTFTGNETVSAGFEIISRTESAIKVWYPLGVSVKKVVNNITIIANPEALPELVEGEEYAVSTLATAFSVPEDVVYYISSCQIYDTDDRYYGDFTDSGVTLSPESGKNYEAKLHISFIHTDNASARYKFATKDVMTFTPSDKISVNDRDYYNTDGIWIRYSINWAGGEEPGEGGNQVTNINVVLDENNLSQYTVGDTLSLDGIKLAVSTTPVTNGDFAALGCPGVMLTEGNYMQALHPEYLAVLVGELGPEPSYSEVCEIFARAAEVGHLGEMNPAWVAITMDALNPNYKLREDDTLGMVIKVGLQGESECEIAQNVTVTLNSEAVSDLITSPAGNIFAFIHVLGAPQPDGTTPPSTVPVASVTLNKSTLSLEVNATETLTATVAPDDATDKTVTWESTDTSVATVNANGVVTAVAAGTATITATAGDKIATCVVTVTAPGGNEQPGIPDEPVTPPTQPDEPVTPPYGDIVLPPVTPTPGGNTGGSNTENVTTGVNTETTVPTTETTVKPSVSNTGSNPTATVTDKMGTTIVDQAKENNSDTVVIAPEFTGSDDSASVVIPTKIVDELGRETTADLVVETPVATVTFGNSDLTTLGQPGGNVVITTEKVAGGVSLDVTVNGQSMPSIPGGVLVNISKENLTPGTVAMIVHEDGSRELVRKSVADVPDQTMFVPLEGSATVIIVDNAQNFTDVQERNWFSDAVAFASGHELFRGITDTEFGPNVSTTRGMLATVIYRMENEPNFTENDLFGDMSGKYYAEAATWAASKGIVTGYTVDEFGGDDQITREQLAAMLWRYAGTPMSYHSVDHFNDADAISSYAEIAVAWANEMGIMNGRNGEVLDPKGEATRAEVAQMLMNFMTLIAN